MNDWAVDTSPFETNFRADSVALKAGSLDM